MFGFLSGFWIYAGVDPEAAISDALLSVLRAFSPSFASSMSIVFWIVPVLGTIGSFYGSFKIGGFLGIVAVSLAFIGGVLIGSIGVWFLVAGIFLGLIAPSLKNRD